MIKRLAFLLYLENVKKNLKKKILIAPLLINISIENCINNHPGDIGPLPYMEESMTKFEASPCIVLSLVDFLKPSSRFDMFG